MSSPDHDIPLYVDLDGCLLRTDTLWESFAAALRAHPVLTVLALCSLVRGRAVLKHRLAMIGRLDITSMPPHRQFRQWLLGQHAQGRRIVLATAADALIAAQVLDQVRDDQGKPLFAAALSSDGQSNLKGAAKLTAIRADAGDRSFDYCGNGPEDLVIFAAARGAIVVGAARRTLATAQRAAKILAVHDPRPSAGERLRAWLRAVRPHQWLKNLLVLVPLITSFHFDEARALACAVLAFVAFSLAASSGYLLNDLLDLASDRQHPRKRARPFAAGELPVRDGFGAAALLFLAAILLALLIGPAFTAWVLVYLAMTGLYSAVGKRIALLDVTMLAGLYTVRVLAGGAAIPVEVSFWLLAFSVFLFFSLALVKRCAELVAQVERNERTAEGRSYLPGDLPVLQMLGVSTSVAALVVLALYTQIPEVLQRYGSPKMLWLILAGLLILLGRLWLATARGRMHDDPLVFLMQDVASRWMIALLLGLFTAAALLRWPL